jgi:hypothetical protein
MEGKAPHRIWAFSFLAWMALVAIPTAAVSIAWMLGLDRDSSAPNLFDLVVLFIFMLPVPAAIAVFALLAPLAITTDLVLRGRTTRLINVVLGAALGVAAYTLYFAGSALLRLPTPFTPRRIIADGASLDTLYRILTAPQTPFMWAVAAVVLTCFVVGGMLIGLGLRHRASIARPA